jgi:hypothetical protein
VLKPRRALGLVASVTLLATVPAAPAKAGVVAEGGSGPGFQRRLDFCLRQFSATGPVSSGIMGDLRGVRVVVKPTGGTNEEDPANPANPRGGQVIHWNPNQNGRYPDPNLPPRFEAPRNPCAALLHELAHAAANVNGWAYSNDCQDLREYTEFYAVRAENWWLNTHGLVQRSSYEFAPHFLPVPAWAKWTRGRARDALPKPPRCVHDRVVHCVDAGTSGRVRVTVTGWSTGGPTSSTAIVETDEKGNRTPFPPPCARGLTPATITVVATPAGG